MDIGAVVRLHHLVGELGLVRPLRVVDGRVKQLRLQELGHWYGAPEQLQEVVLEEAGEDGAILVLDNVLDDCTDGPYQIVL